MWSVQAVLHFTIVAAELRQAMTKISPPPHARSPIQASLERACRLQANLIDKCHTAFRPNSTLLRFQHLCAYAARSIDFSCIRVVERSMDMSLITERLFEGFFSSVGLRLFPLILVRGSPVATAAGGLQDKTTLAKH